jgi:hypothetical protein
MTFQDEPLTHEEEHIIANMVYQEKVKAERKQMWAILEDRD